MQKNELDNLTGEVIKELISDGEVNIEDLDVPALYRLFDYETDMLVLGNGDMELIDKCSKLLNEKEPDEVISDEKFEEILHKTFAEHVIIDDEKDVPKAKRPVKRPISRRVALVAAIVAIMLVSTTLVAAALGVNIFEYIKEAARKPQGEELVADGFTFYNHCDAKQYSSIENLIEDENLDIMYPTKFPDGITIESIRLSTEINGNEIVQIFTNDTNTAIKIEISGTPIASSGHKTIEYNGLTYYIQEGNLLSASCYFKNNVYYITSETKDNVLLIIENMKE